MAGGHASWKQKKSKEVLQRFDGNEDGTLSLYELTAAFKKMGVKSPIQRAYKTLLTFEEDGDGSINKESEIAAVGTYLRVTGSRSGKTQR